MEEKLITDFFSEEKTHWWHIAKRNLTRRFLGELRNKVLVLGSGGGLFLSELKSSGHDVKAIDLYFPSCMHARGKLKVPAINADLERNLPVLDEAFDAVILTDVLEHIEHEKELLAEVFRCLKPGACAIISVPAWQHLYSDWDVRLGHKRRYTLSCVRQLIRGAGLSIQKLSYFNMPLYPLAFLYRKLLPALGRYVDNNASDFKASENFLFNRVFNYYCAFEAVLLSFLNLPFGLSIIAVGKKNG